jgi:nucleotide-binding universal stress UspA family protein
MMMKKIILGYDDSDAAKRALERAAELTKALGAELIVTSIAPIMANIGRSAGPGDPADPPSEHIEELKHAQSYLEGQGVTADYLAGLGHPAETIADLARERGADLIVVGHHHSAISRLLGQSVSESVAHKVSCDVLLVY